MMIRRRIEEEDEGSERWLVSYADFITLLFAFFVVMYSISSVNQGKYNELSSSINQAFTKTDTQQQAIKNNQAVQAEAKPREAAPLPSDAKTQVLQGERDAMTALGEDLSKTLSPLIKEGQARVMQNSQGLQIDIKDSALFVTGSADLIESAKTMLAEMILPIISGEHTIIVEGHTDNSPIYIQNPAFFSNWELSAVRASSVTDALNKLGIEKIRLSALGFGPTTPISDNATEEGRATNRHISIVILYESLNNPIIHNVEIKPQ